MTKRAYNSETKEWAEWDGSQWVVVPPSAPPQAPPPPPPPSTGGFGDVLASVNRGASLGLSDMAVPAMQAGYQALTQGAPFGETYAREKTARGQRAQQFRGEHPWVSGGSELGGGGMLGIAGGMRQALPRAASWAARHPFLASFPAGAAYGGIYEGATAPPGEALPGMGRGAAIGAVAGPAGYGLARGAQGALAGTKRAFTPKSGRIFEREVLAPGGTTGQEVASAMQRSGPGTTVLEATGAPGLRHAQGITGRSPAAAQRIRNVVDSRLAGRWERLQGDMRRLLGKEGKTFHREFKEIAKRRATEAAPHYKAARGDSVSPEQMKGYMDYLKNEAAQYEGTTLGGAINKVGRMLTKTQGKAKVAKTNVGTELHAVKMQLDDMIDTAKRQGQGNRARVLVDAKKNLLSMMDDASPSYAKGRELFSGDSSVMDAMELGRKVLREDAEVTQMALQAMSRAERDAYLVGAAKALRDAAGSKPPQAFYRHGGIQERLAFAFPDKKSMDEFINVSLTREAKLSELSTKILHGSQTHQREEATRNLSMAMEDLMEGQQSAASMRGLRFLKALKGGYSEEVVQELTGLLIEDNPKAFAEKASKILKPEDFEQMRRMFTTTGTVVGAEQATRARQ